MMKWSILIGSRSGPNFTIRTAKMDRSWTDRRFHSIFITLYLENCFPSYLVEFYYSEDTDIPFGARVEQISEEDKENADKFDEYREFIVELQARSTKYKTSPI